MISKMSLQMSSSSVSILRLYVWINVSLSASPFCSMDEITRHDARREPMTFLYATDSKLRSSTVNSCGCCATAFMWSTISSNLDVGGRRRAGKRVRFSNGATGGLENGSQRQLGSGKFPNLPLRLLSELGHVHEAVSVHDGGLLFDSLCSSLSGVGQDAKIEAFFGEEC